MAYDERYPLKDYLNSINLNKNNLMGEDSDPAWKSKVSCVYNKQVYVTSYGYGDVC